MTDPANGAVTGAPHVWLRLEGATACAVAATCYARGGYGWLLFALLFLVPDVSFLAYLAGPRIGAAAYNALHSYVGPALLAATGLRTGWSLAVPLIWAAHIGFDRAAGYGLKYPSAFTATHLGRLRGRRDA